MAVDRSRLKDVVKQKVMDKAAELLGATHAPPELGEAIWISSLSWDPQAKPECLVVMCGDWRYLPHTQDFLKDGLGLKYYQTLAVPGGVQWLALPDVLPKHNKVARWAVEFLLETRDLKRLICIAHQDCLAYQDSTALSSLAHLATGKTIAEHQVEQLRKVGRELSEEFKVAVELYYASVDEGAVVFHKVEQPQV